MPKIITDSQQINALKQIEALIQDTRLLNAIIEQKELCISAGSGKKAVSRSIDVEDLEKYQALLRKAKERNGKKANTLSARFRIELSDEENQLLGLDESPDISESLKESADCTNIDENSQEN